METFRLPLLILEHLGLYPICQGKKNWEKADCPNGTVWYKQVPRRRSGASFRHKLQKPQRPPRRFENAWPAAMSLNSCPKRAERSLAGTFFICSIPSSWAESMESTGQRSQDLPQPCRQSLPNLRNMEMCHSVVWSPMYSICIHRVERHTFPPVFVTTHPFLLNAPLS